jgi:hypothetical protein
MMLSAEENQLTLYYGVKLLYDDDLIKPFKKSSASLSGKG